MQLPDNAVCHFVAQPLFPTANHRFTRSIYPVGKGRLKPFQTASRNLPYAKMANRAGGHTFMAAANFLRRVAGAAADGVSVQQNPLRQTILADSQTRCAFRGIPFSVD